MSHPKSDESLSSWDLLAVELGLEPAPTPSPQAHAPEPVTHDADAPSAETSFGAESSFGADPSEVSHHREESHHDHATMPNAELGEDANEEFGTEIDDSEIELVEDVIEDVIEDDSETELPLRPPVAHHPQVPLAPINLRPNRPMPWPTDDEPAVEIEAEIEEVIAPTEAIIAAETDSELEGDEDSAVAATAEGDPAAPGTGKRRRRRRRRSGRGKTEGTPAGATAAVGSTVIAGEPIDHTDDNEDDTDGMEPEAIAASVSPSIIERASEIDDDEDDDSETVAAVPREAEFDLDVLANWNVPTWNELIAGLYRPER